MSLLQCSTGRDAIGYNIIGSALQEKGAEFAIRVLFWSC